MTFSRSDTVRLMVPRAPDIYPHPEGNVVDSYPYQAAEARAWWGFILHAYRTRNHDEAWELFQAETLAVLEGM